MHRNKRSLVSKADSTDKRLNKMSSEDKNFRQQTYLLSGLRKQIRRLDVEIRDQEASLGDVKRDKAREWMGDLLGGLLECSATGAVVATSARTIIECVPTEPTQPGLPRVHYSGYSQVEFLVAEAEQTIGKISNIGVAGVSFGSEAGVSFKSEVGGETSQPSNGSGVGNVPGNPPSTLSLPIQPTPVQPIQIYASSTLPNAAGQWSRLSLFDEPSPANPAGPSMLTSSHPPRLLGLTRDIPGLPSSSSSSAVRLTSTHRPLAQLIATEEQIMLDAEIARHLQDTDSTGDIYTDEMQDTDWYVTGTLHFHVRL